jgi:hypothetical protein
LPAAAPAGFASAFSPGLASPSAVATAGFAAVAATATFLRDFGSGMLTVAIAVVSECAKDRHAWDLQIGHVQRLAQRHRTDVDLDLLRNVGRQALDLDVAQVVLENSALRLDAFGLAGQHDRHFETNARRHRDALQIDVHDFAAHRVHLDLAHQGLHRLVTGFELEIQQTVRLAGAQHDVERLAIEHHRPRRLALAIDDPRNLGHGAAACGPRPCHAGRAARPSAISYSASESRPPHSSARARRTARMAPAANRPVQMNNELTDSS